MQKFEIDGHVASFLPEGREWRLVWADEFDGTELDRSKWDFRLSMMGRRHVTWGTEGVRLDGSSNVVFTVYEKDGEICSSQLQTGYNFMDAESPRAATFDGGLVWPIGELREPLFAKKYGYFECRCKLQTKSGWWSAFWLQSPMIGATLHPESSGVEIDVLESFVPGEAIHHSLHYAGYGKNHKQVKSGAEKTPLALGEYHTFAVDWRPDGYTFYIDGSVSGEVEGYSAGVPLFIMLSTEVQGYRSASHKASDAARLAVGDEFIVDYVRVFDAD